MTYVFSVYTDVLVFKVSLGTMSNRHAGQVYIGIRNSEGAR